MDETTLDVEESDFSSELGIEKRGDEETRALLLGVYSGAKEKDRCDEYLDELKNLADTFGVETIGKFTAPIRRVDAATYLHEGKLEEIAAEIAHVRANLLIFDEEISPAQQRNLEKILKIPVMDRTELILEIFAQRAQTKEARLQVELAQTKYQFPRLKRLWGHFSRQRMKGGFLKGEGEKQLEIDKRLLKKKVEKLNQELREVTRYRSIQSASRRKSGIPTFAIVGYTNAGKSTLLNALTESNVLVEDKLFATLDPTTRKFTLPNNQEILLTDTVGFIRKLPHTLVAAFKSTLEAALQDDVLLHLVDVSHPLAEEHAATTVALLKELNAQEEAIITVLNKVDAVNDRALIERFRARYPKTVQISALRKEGFDDLMDAMMRELAAKRVTAKFRIPQSEYALVAILRREGNVLYEEYEENDVIIRAQVPVISLHHFEKYRIEE